MHWSSTKQHLHKLIECNLFSSWYTWKIAHLVFLNTVKPAQTTTFIKRPPAINDHFYPPRRFILYILTGFNDHLHNATNDRQNAFPNDHFNFFQRPLTLLHDEFTTKMGKLTGDVPQMSHSFSVYANRKWFFLYPK
jgi:hypothetical protein